jgi:hemerythrin
MRMEHREIREHLEKIRGKIATKDTATSDLETSLIEILTAHNLKEESKEESVVPWFDNSLSAGEKEETLARMGA